MSHRRNNDKKKRRDERLHAGKVLAAVAPSVPLDAIFVETPASPSTATLTAVEQAQRMEAIRLYEIFEQEIVAPLRQRFLRAALINKYRGMKEGLAAGTSEKK